jgi:predicted transcriptional regulator
MDLKSSILANWLRDKRVQQMPALGPRELEALEYLWQQGTLTALQLRKQAGLDQVSLNTIQSTLERLHRKGLVGRERQGRAYHYRATLTRADIVRRTLHDLTRDVARGDLAPVISGFAEFMADGDPDIEAKLVRLFEAAERSRD